MNGFNFMGITKTKLVIVIIGIIVIWSASYIIHLYETQDSFKVENIPYRKIDTIEISNREIQGDSSIIIADRDSIAKVGKMLIGSKIVSFDNINTKANKGEYFIFLHIKNSKTVKWYLTNTSYSGGILRSGDYFYQNTPFLNFVISKLRANNSSNLN